MTRLRTRVRLTAKNWAVIYTAVAVLSVRTSDSESLQRAARAVIRRIGFRGMAARDRGVAPVRKRSTPRAPRF